MFEDSSLSQSPVLSSNTGSQETYQDRPALLKKCKNITKSKVQAKRNINHGSSAKANITKEQKKEIQKEKNRIAAQLSRDRQKLYVESL